MSLEIENPSPEVLSDFQDFVCLVLGIKPKETKISMPAMLYRAGVTNAADKGIDVWTNFGPIVQVKHLSLRKEEIEDIAESVATDNIRMIIVCIDAEKDAILAVLGQIGWASRIQGIVTLNDLKKWYKICLEKYASSMGESILKHLRTEFKGEFPMVTEIDAFLEERGYDPRKLTDAWKLDVQAKLLGPKQ